MKKILILNCIFAITLSAQSNYDIMKDRKFFNVVADAENKINPYYIGGNSAFMKYDLTDEMLNIKTEYNDKKNNFRGFYDPEEERLYSVIFSGKKEISANQIFKGALSFQKEERLGWNCIATRDYNTGNPYLIGDNSAGKTHYNSVIVNSEYSALIEDQFLLGLRLNYNVDQGLKEVSPKPTSEHRDIFFKLGLGYIFSNELELGAYFNVADANEQIDYQPDETAMFVNTIILKLRGLDLPYAVSKTTENRQSFRDDYIMGFNFLYMPYEHLKICGNFSLGKEIEVIKDDANNPTNDGVWHKNLSTADLRGLYKYSETLAFGLYYNMSYDEGWAEHPIYHSSYQRSFLRNNVIGLESSYKFDKNLEVALQADYNINSYVLDDYYSDIYENVKSNGLGIGAGIKSRLDDDLNLNLFYKWTKLDNNKNEIKLSKLSDYFVNTSFMSYLCLIADKAQNLVKMDLEYNTRDFGIFILHLDYMRIDASNVQILKNESNNFYNVSLEFKIKAY